MSVKQSDWTILLTATAGLEDFTLNAVLGIQQTGISLKDVVLVVDEVTAAAYSNIPLFGACAIHTYDQALPSYKVDLPADYAVYGTSSFSHVMSFRIPIILRLLDQGRNLLFADVDVAWLRNPLSYLDEVLKHFPMAMQTEAVPVFPPVYCMGFMALAPRSETVTLLKSFQKEFIDDRLLNSSTSMQATFHRLLRESPSLSKDIFPLPESQFPNGLLHGLINNKSESNELIESDVKPFIIHANFTRGLDNKRAILRKCGAWSEPTSCYSV